MGYSPLISVIVPNFNHAPFLKRRIDSILSQTFQDFELILLDDCSTDKSLDVLVSYQDHQKVSHLIFNEKNSGSPFIQWNMGFELARGEFIWIAESDDWCEPSLLESILQPLLKDESVVLSYCQSMLVYDNGMIGYKTQNTQLEETIPGWKFVKSRMFGDTSIVNAGMALFRKATLSKISGEFLKMKNAGDWMFWTEVALMGNVHICGKYLNYCNRHRGTVTSKAEISGHDLQEGNKVFRFILQNAQPSKPEIKSALKQRLNIFFQQRRSFIDKETEKSAREMVLSLHPLARKLYYKKLLKKILSGVTKTIGLNKQ